MYAQDLIIEPEILRIGDESKIAAPGLLDAGDPVDFDAAVPFETAAEALREVLKLQINLRI